MAAERPSSVPNLREAKIQPEKSQLISPVTIVSALPVGERTVAGKPPEQRDVHEMIKNVATDLRAQGIPISSEDIRAVEEQVEKGLIVSPSYSPGKERSGKKESVPLPEVDLNEYKTVVESMVRNYGIDEGAWGKISHIIGVTTLMGDFISGMQRQRFTTTKGRELMANNFGWVTREMQLRKLSPRGFVDNFPRLMKDKGGQVTKRIAQAAWPFIASPLYYLWEKQAGKLAGRLFMVERTNLQEQVNNRIADSALMQRFEYMDKVPSAEMLEIINRGKDATLDLMSAVYEELIPLEYALAGTVGKQLLINKWDFGLALVKRLVMETRVKPNARRIQVQNDEALKRWDAVNTKLLTTLQGLETVRTSGNVEAGSDILYQALAERDFVEAGGMREKRRQDKAMNDLFDVLDVALPVGTEGYKLWNIVRSGKHPQTGKDLKAYDLFNSVADAWFRVTGSKAEQQDLRQMMLQKTHLYVNRIIPDIQDIKRMEEVLGPYDLLDHPQGLWERARVPVTDLTGFTINVKNLKFKDILHGVSLEIPEGSFVTIKGPSGIGKSTLFRHLVGLYKGEPGAVTYGGVDIDGIKKYGKDSLFTRIGYVNQSPQYFEDMSLRENLLLWTKQEVSNERIASVLRDLNLDKLIDRLDTKSKHFSGGEMRRIGIARALLKDPKVLFLDEPTANLDAASTLQVLKVIQELRKKRPDMTVVAITHDPVFEKISERIVDFAKLNQPAQSETLRDGQVLTASAKPEALPK